MPNEQFFSYIMVRTSYILMRWWFLLCTRPNMASWIFIVLHNVANWNKSSQVDMSLHSETLFWFTANQSLLLLLSAVCLAEKQQISILVFGLTWTGLEPTIYRSPGERANNYTTNLVLENSQVGTTVTFCTEYKQNLTNYNVLDQHGELDFYIDSSLKQQSLGRLVASPRHIILIPRQPFFVFFTPACWVLGGKAMNTTNYSTWGNHANYYTTNVIRFHCKIMGAILLLDKLFGYFVV
jgi:hypothetical protein